MEKKVLLIAIIGFFIGYVLMSLIIFISGGVAPIYYEGPKAGETRPLTILNSLNPLEPMSPAFYMIIFAQK